MFEASDSLGGHWSLRPGQSGIWPGMTTNTSRAMTAFADLAPHPDLPLHPRAEQIRDYLEAYAERFSLVERIRFHAPVENVQPGWSVDGESFDAVIVAAGHFRRPSTPDALRAFGGELLHPFDYPGAEALAGKRALILGNGISGSEIAADLAGSADVTHAFRKPRYVMRKNDDGASSDWRWYTYATALARRHLPPEEFSVSVRNRILRLVGNPADYGAPAPDPDLRVAGVALTQDWLPAVSDGRVTCRPDIEWVAGRKVRFADGTSGEFDVLVAATGYERGVPCLGEEVLEVLGPGMRLHHQTLHPDLPGFAMVGHFYALGPYFPLLEVQARWAVSVLAGHVTAPDAPVMRAAIATPPRPMEAHDLLGLEIAEELGVVPDLDARPELREPLLFGPLLPARWRLDGPGSHPDAAEWFTAQLAASRRPEVDPEVIEAYDQVMSP